jgi:hypothetical protein
VFPITIFVLKQDMTIRMGFIAAASFAALAAIRYFG